MADKKRPCDCGCGCVPPGKRNDETAKDAKATKKAK